MAAVFAANFGNPRDQFRVAGGQPIAVEFDIVHEILEDAVEPLAAAGQALAPDTVDAAIGRLRERGRTLWA